MNTKHGFLTPCIDPKDGFVYELSCTLNVEGVKTDHANRPSSPEGLISFAVLHHLTHLWIMPDYGHQLTEEQARIKGQCPGQENYTFTSYTRVGETFLASITGRCVNPMSEEVTVCWLASSGWHLPNDVDSVCKAFEKIEETLGVAIHPHPGVVGLAYLRKIDDKNYWRYFALPQDVEWGMIKSVSVSSLGQLKQVTDTSSLSKKYLYCYDRNGSQPYAASQIKAGIGQPVARRGGEFDHLIPGFWMCDIDGLDELWDGLPLLPTNREWLPTPLVKMAVQQGCKVKVHEAYIWPDKKDRAPVFHRWSHTLWDLRQSYAKGTGEREAIKSIMNNTIGMLRRKSGETYHYRDYRPDWYSLILAEERAVVWYKAFQVWKATGLRPIGAYKDALYYAADEEIDVLTTRIDKDGVSHSLKDSLGGYKLEWVFPLEQEVKDILMASQPKGAANRLGLLKKWGRDNGYL